MFLFDIANFAQISFQDPASPIMEAIIDLHHNILFFLIIVSVLVCYLLFQLIKRWWYFWEWPSDELTQKDRGQNVINILKQRNDYLKVSNIIHAPVLEIVWTLVPSFILILIAIPSFALLYAVDEVLDPRITLKVIGHQWYWSYEYSDIISPDFQGLNFDSYMVPTTELSTGALRLLEVDNPMVLPIQTQIRLIITATDVLHAFAVPSLGVKVDAVPGRLNQTAVFIKRTGDFYGQCSELCGVNHGFMPIHVKAVKLADYLKFLKNN